VYLLRAQSAPKEGPVDRRSKVELFEQIRREYEHGGGTIGGIAQKLGIHELGQLETEEGDDPAEKAGAVYQEFQEFRLPG
jgi:hypothetical protein